MNLQAEVEKACRVMAQYGVSQEDQVTVVKVLMDAGVEHCLDEQARLREEKEAMIQHAQRNPLGRRLVN